MLPRALRAFFTGGPRSGKDETEEIRAAITDLARAIRVGDAAAADGLISPPTRRASGGSRRFAAAVAAEHPVLVTGGALTFAGVSEAGRQRLQSTVMPDAAGGLHLIDWQMVRDGDRWVVHAIQFRAAAEGSA